jgi:hypothetical protein
MNVDDKSAFALMEYGRKLANLCARVNWCQIEAVEEKLGT